MKLLDAIGKTEAVVNKLDSENEHNGVVTYLKWRGLDDAGLLSGLPDGVGTVLGTGIMIGLVLAEEEKMSD